MGSKLIVFLSLLLAMALFISSEVAARKQSETSNAVDTFTGDNRASRAALFDDMDSLEEGGLRSSSSYPSGIDEHENEKTMDSLHDRVSFLKRVRKPSSITNITMIAGSSVWQINQTLTGDIHEEVESHNRMLDRTGNEMDASRGIMSGTMDRFKMVFAKKSNRRACKFSAYIVVAFFVLYYIIRVLLYFLYG
ncbi:hypothetical protein CASFOL_021555 [Castilleja foliolosa]|uniref:t-SNARE coiled-coil homology domain-containing protein n=1 Tax=Castilleja foliolosa TaxID=1961234 RepID=A0ABD3CYX1_9LAMI